MYPGTQNCFPPICGTSRYVWACTFIWFYLSISLTLRKLWLSGFYSEIIKPSSYFRCPVFCSAWLFHASVAHFTHTGWSAVRVETASHAFTRAPPPPDTISKHMFDLKRNESTSFSQSGSVSTDTCLLGLCAPCEYAVVTSGGGDACSSCCCCCCFHCQLVAQSHLKRTYRHKRNQVC